MLKSGITDMILKKTLLDIYPLIAHFLLGLFDPCHQQMPRAPVPLPPPHQPVDIRHLRQVDSRQ